MNIYLISQEKNNEWETFDSAVVVANSEEEARQIMPSRDLDPEAQHGLKECKFGSCYRGMSTWTDSKNVQVKLIGTLTCYEYRAGDTICSSYNAG